MTFSPSTPLRQRAAYQALEQHYQSIKDVQLKELFAGDPTRGTTLTLDAEGIYLDYSKQRVTAETIGLLIDLAKESGLADLRSAMFAGEHINITEDRAVLHVALRAPAGEVIKTAGADVVPDVHEVLDRMRAFAERIRSGEWKGHTGKPIRNIVNIGIGGSDLGPVMAYEALKHYSQRDLTFRFVSNVDGTDFAEKTHDLDPEETLFIVSSKTFTTLETMTNAGSARDWSLAALGDAAAVAKSARSLRRLSCFWRNVKSTRTCCVVERRVSKPPTIRHTDVARSGTARFQSDVRCRQAVAVAPNPADCSDRQARRGAA